MGNRSRRRSHADGSPDAPAAGVPSVGSRNDPLYGIPDTNVPYLADIRLARALSGPVAPGRRNWRRGLAFVWLLSICVGLVVFIVNMFRL
jgi:hypothetical protein